MSFTACRRFSRSTFCHWTFFWPATFCISEQFSCSCQILAVLLRWQTDVLMDPASVSPCHLRNVLKLFVTAQKALHPWYFACQDCNNTRTTWRLVQNKIWQDRVCRLYEWCRCLHVDETNGTFLSNVDGSHLVVYEMQRTNHACRKFYENIRLKILLIRQRCVFFRQTAFLKFGGSDAPASPRATGS